MGVHTIWTSFQVAVLKFLALSNAGSSIQTGPHSTSSTFPTRGTATRPRSPGTPNSSCINGAKFQFQAVVWYAILKFVVIL